MATKAAPLILVVEDDPGAAMLQRRRLERARFRVKVALDVDEASEALAAGGVDLVLLDYRLGSATGLDFHRRMRATGIDVPVIFVSAGMDDSSIIEAIRSGVRDVVVKNTEYLEQLPSTVHAALRQSVAAGPEWSAADHSDNCVLIVEDDPGVATLQRRRLERAGYNVLVAMSADDAMEKVRSGKVGLAILDLRLPGNVTGLDLYERFKASGWDVPAILVTAFSDQEVAIRALRIGIRDLVPKSADYLDYLSSAVERVTTQVHIERKLVESELRFASIIGTTMDSIVMCDADLCIVLFNRSAEEMFECPASEALRQKIDRFMPELRLDSLDSERTHAPGGFQRRVEVDGVSAAGKRIPIEVSVSAVTVHGKRLFTVIARDISERRRIEETLRDADRRKDEFLGMLAHELRNPLAAIMNAGEVLSRMHLDAAGQKLTGVVKRQTKALARMVDDLLDVSRVTLGKIQLAKEPLIVEQVVRRASDSIRETIAANGLELRVQLDGEPMWILGDATRLEQVLVNLLSNAVKFTPEGGQITLVARRDRQDALICVCDTGIGIDQNLLPKIFELFVQGDTSLDRSKSGLGIGLALVRQVVSLHGGRVEARSAGLQKGSEFIVHLPLASQYAFSAAEDGDAEPEGMSQKLRIVVVDDQRDVADSVATLLESCGHEAQAMYDGAKALEEARKAMPDVMFVDIGMPGMTGYELAQRVRADPQLARVRLVALTGYGREQERALALNAGFDVHLTKPVAAARLQAALGSLRSK
jgi:PAS domain S-box-containing protein